MKCCDNQVIVQDEQQTVCSSCGQVLSERIILVDQPDFESGTLVSNLKYNRIKRLFQGWCSVLQCEQCFDSCFQEYLKLEKYKTVGAHKKGQIRLLALLYKEVKVKNIPLTLKEIQDKTGLNQFEIGKCYRKLSDNPVITATPMPFVKKHAFYESNDDLRNSIIEISEWIFTHINTEIGKSNCKLVALAALAIANGFINRKQPGTSIFNRISQHSKTDIRLIRLTFNILIKELDDYKSKFEYLTNLNLFECWSFLKDTATT